MPEFQTFKDLSVTFKKHPVTDDLVTVKDNAAISQAIMNLDYGTAGIIRSAVIEVLEKYEPRIRVTEINVMPDFDNNAYSVELSYAIRGREDRPVSVQIFLERTR
jgi:hypothetical protein